MLIDYDFAIEIIILGQASVGKTNLINRFVNYEFNENINPTIGNDYFKSMQKIHGMNILVKFWDTAGQERFATLSNMIFRNANGVIFVYDITKRETFEKIPIWHNFVNNGNTRKLKFMLVGNKNDLAEKREVSVEEARSYAISHDMLFFETSAKTNKNGCVDKAMEALIGEEVKEMAQEPKERTSMIKGELVKTFKKIELKVKSEESTKSKQGCC